MLPFFSSWATSWTFCLMLYCAQAALEQFSEIDWVPASANPPAQLLMFGKKPPGRWYTGAACNGLPYIPMHIPIRVFVDNRYSDNVLLWHMVFEGQPEAPFSIYQELKEKYNVSIGHSYVEGTVGIKLGMEEPNHFYPEILEHGNATETLKWINSTRDFTWHLTLPLDIYSGYPYKPMSHMMRTTVYRVPIYYPFPMTRIPAVSPKKYDIIHTGCSSPFDIQDALVYFDKAVVVCDDQKFSNLTNKTMKVGFGEKMLLISATRIMIAFNMLPSMNETGFCPNKYHSWYKKRNDWPYEAFKFPEFDGYMQWKARTTEAFFGRALVLYRWDPFYSLERLGFQPDKHFIYYNSSSPAGSPTSLIGRAKHILANWPRYEQVALQGHRFARRALSTKAWWRDYVGTMRTPRAERNC